MNHFFGSGLLNTAIWICLGIFVYFKDRKRLLNQTFSLFALSVAIYSFGFSMQAIAPTRNSSLFWIRIILMATILIPIFFLQFAYVAMEKKNNRKILVGIYAIGITLEIINFFTKWLASDPIPKYTFKYLFQAGFLYPILFLFFAVIVTHVFIELRKGYRNSTGIRHNQLKYLFWAPLVGFSGGSTGFLLGYNCISFYPIIPIATYGVSTYGILIVYAIFRYHLLEIEVVVRKTLVFAGLFTFVSAVFVSSTYLVQTFLSDITGSKYLGMAIVVLVIVLFQEPLRNWLIKTTDRFLLQKKYDYQKILKDASEGMAMVRELKWLLGLITHIVSSKMRVSNIGIFLQEDDGDPNHYYLKAKRGKESIEQNFLSSDNPVCLWLKENKRPLVLEEVEYLLQRKNISSSETSLKNILVRIKNQMQGLSAKIILPSFYKGGLLGFLSLGYKLSGDIYTKEDLVLLSTLSNSAAIAIENARLFDNLIDEIEINNHLRKEEEESYMQMMMSLAKTIDAKDSYTYDHVEMVYQYGVNLTQYLPGVNKDALKASLRLHDLGKIGVPDSILSKQGPLTPEEWKKIKDHTILGARILAPLKRFEYVAKVILHHQEKFDGTGYPAGLKEDQIPLESRIIAVVDAYHAMVSDRPYRKALSKQVAISELRKFSGTQFDPIVVEAFLKLLEEKYGITETV